MITTELLLELLNGIWAICSLALTLLCAAYLRHEVIARQQCWRARKLRWSKRFTRGMRVATAVMAISAGICLRTSLVFFLRFNNADMTEMNADWLLLATAVGVIGFLCAIREMSNLFSNVPWALTVAACAGFVVFELLTRFG